MNALILVDIQKDFLPGGSLAVPGADEIIPVVNKLQDYFDVVVATKDWHPKSHKSFASNHKNRHPGDTIQLDGISQTLWPDHCVQGTEGAEFADDLRMSKVIKIIQKGTNPKIDSYSAFYDNQHRRSTGLHEYLTKKEIDMVCITGLATDVCVRFTALDALMLGYKTLLVDDATKAVGGKRAHDKTIYELNGKGAEIFNSNNILELFKYVYATI